MGMGGLGLRCGGWEGGGRRKGMVAEEERRAWEGEALGLLGWGSRGAFS